MLGFRMEEISALINDINIVTKINCVLFDRDFNLLHDYKDSMCRLCTEVRKDPERRAACRASDLHGMQHALACKKTYCYQCHMGLTETVTPIFYEDVLVGFMMIGQLLSKQNEDEVGKRIAALPDAEALAKALAAMRRTTDAEISAMNNVVEMCVSYLRMQKLIQFKETPISVLLRQYIETHLAEELNIKTLCKQFNLSKSSLYLLSSEVLGKGVTDYIRERRMQTAAELLIETTLPISAVAERVGYTDTNYFTKVFKKAKGMTPSDWRTCEKD